MGSQESYTQLVYAVLYTSAVNSTYALCLSEYITHVSDYFIRLLLHHSTYTAYTPIYPAATLPPLKSPGLNTFHTAVRHGQEAIPCLHPPDLLNSTSSMLQLFTVQELLPVTSHQDVTPYLLQLFTFQQLFPVSSHQVTTPSV